MIYAVRYYLERVTQVEAESLVEAEARARGMALTHAWTLLSVSPADDPKPMPGEGTWKFPEFGHKKL